MILGGNIRDKFENSVKGALTSQPNDDFY